MTNRRLAARRARARAVRPRAVVPIPRRRAALWSQQEGVRPTVDARRHWSRQPARMSTPGEQDQEWFQAPWPYFVGLTARGSSQRDTHTPPRADRCAPSARTVTPLTFVGHT